VECFTGRNKLTNDENLEIIILDNFISSDCVIFENFKKDINKTYINDFNINHKNLVNFITETIFICY
jgi:hypothetical protein